MINSIVPWNPFREFDSVPRHLLSLFDAGSRGPGREAASGEAAPEWAPAVDIIEDERGYTFKADLSGVRKEDVQVTLEDGVLTLAGERKFDREEKGVTYHRIERAYGAFARSFTLPDDIDGEQVSASHQDGVLTVIVPKAANAKPRKVQVKVA
jgi:HSP20 family protein